MWAFFDLIREVFAMTPDAKMHGYTNGRFSFNVKADVANPAAVMV